MIASLTAYIEESFVAHTKIQGYFTYIHTLTVDPVRGPLLTRIMGYSVHRGTPFSLSRSIYYETFLSH